MAAGLFGLFAWGAESAHTVPYVPSASSEGHAGLVRIESRSSRSGEVRVVAVDDAGQRMEAGRLTLDAGRGDRVRNGCDGVRGRVDGADGDGTGPGDWRLELTTELDIEARAYARSEGFVTALHDAALLSGEVELPFFNPGGAARRSVLRLANARGEPAAVSVRGVDDAGRAAGPVTADLGPWEARGYAAEELESGSAAGLSGSLGDGDGGWRLTLSADRGSAYATNLLLDGSVLSSVPGSMSRGSGGLHRVPLFPPASDGAGRRGVVRVVNRSAASAEVSIEAFDATDRAYEELRLALEAESSAEFDATDLEQGNAEKGLTGSTGPGEGDWWLELRSESDIEVLSYVDTASGPLSALRGTAGVETDTGMRYEALLWGESGEVRLLNAGGAPAEVRLSGTDDAGSSGGAVELTLAPWSARTLTATALAEGEAGMLGALGAGSGSWRLRLEADREIDVLSLVRGSGGMLSDVSRRGRPAGAPPRTEVIDATARGRPDLWVAASASESELSPGEAFDLTATVGNRGGDASATTLRYYRSAGAAITAADAELGTDAVAELAAGATSAGSLTLNAPTAAGAYYYGACADAVAGESITTNNCSTGVAVKVTEPPRRPDLAVAATPSDAALDPGESFRLSATVRNVGDSASAATFLRYYRSTDATISGADTEVGTDAVDALSASGTSAESITLTAPSTAGIYYYGACVEPVDGESDTTNNCSPSIRVDVVEPGVPDLEVGMPLVDDASPEAGGSFTLSATVTNAGDGVARSTTVRYYRSADATIARSDTEVGTDAVNALAASGTSAESITLTAPSTAGIYYYGACVEPVDGESDTTNNCSPSIRVDVVEPGVPDLEVGMPLVDDASPEAGGSFTLSATVTNAGDGVARSTTVRYYRSADATIAEVGHGSGDGRGECAGRLRDECGVDHADSAVDSGHLLLRGVRGAGGRGIGHHEQLFAVDQGRRGRAGGAGPRGGDAVGGRREPGGRRIVHTVGDGDERGRRGGAVDDGALLPLGGRDDHDLGRGGGNEHGGGFGRLREERGVDQACRAIDGGRVLLRNVRGCCAGRVGHDEQLLGGSGGDGPGATARPDGDDDVERVRAAARGPVHPDGGGAQCGRRGRGGDDGALLPVDGRHDRAVGHGAGRGRCAGAGGGERRGGVAGADGAGVERHVPLRSVRGAGAGRVGHDEQLLGGVADRGAAGLGGDDPRDQHTLRRWNSGHRDGEQRRHGAGGANAADPLRLGGRDEVAGRLSGA